MTPADAIALIDQDIAYIDQVTKRFQELDPPAECSNMREGVLALIQEQRTLFERLKRSVINCDIEAYNALRADWQHFDETAEDRVIRFWEDMYSFHDEYMELLNRGYDIQAVHKGSQLELEDKESEEVAAFLVP